MFSFSNSTCFCLSLPGDDPCSGNNYTHLSEGDRTVSSTTSDIKCDADDLEGGWESWYRVSGGAGNALAAVTAPAKKHCGTKVQVYLAQSHPIPSEGIVQREVCGHKVANTCNNPQFIDVVNCGAFYLYKLVKFRECNGNGNGWRYCTNGVQGK